MAYHGYIPFIKNYLNAFQSPKILEIGVDKGVTLIPLIVHLKSKEEFDFFGIDVLMQESMLITTNNIDLTEKQRLCLIEKNSLEILPILAEEKYKFDVVLIDGDHNYHTVAKELSYLNDITYQQSVVIIDDYLGRWSEKDLWYSTREEYKGVKNASMPVETEKHGVKSAVDEFLLNNQQWKSKILMQGEPILLTRNS